MTKIWLTILPPNKKIYAILQAVDVSSPTCWLTLGEIMFHIFGSASTNISAIPSFASLPPPFSLKKIMIKHILTENVSYFNDLGQLSDCNLKVYRQCFLQYQMFPVYHTLYSMFSDIAKSKQFEQKRAALSNCVFTKYFNNECFDDGWWSTDNLSTFYLDRINDIGR